MFTKKRAFPYYQRATNPPPLILKKRQEVYNNEMCHLCNNSPDNHERGNSSCIITITMHNEMTKKIINLIEKHIPKEKQWSINTWCSHTIQNPHISSDPNQPFPLMWGDKGIIPKTLPIKHHK